MSATNERAEIDRRLNESLRTTKVSCQLALLHDLAMQVVGEVQLSADAVSGLAFWADSLYELLQPLAEVPEVETVIHGAHRKGGAR